MKNALILHGTSSNSQSNWFDWLRIQLEKDSYYVWVPDLPGSNNPSIQSYNHYILDPPIKFEFTNNTIIIGHSSGAVEILGLLNDPKFPSVTIKCCFLIGAFKGDLDREDLKGMNQHFEMNQIKLKSRKFVFIHSDDDPFCPVSDAKDLSEELNALFIEFKGQKHFSYEGDSKYSKFPELLEIIKQETK